MAAAATVGMDSVYALSSMDDVVTGNHHVHLPGGDSSNQPPRRRTNIYRTSSAPIWFTLKLLGMGENDFRNRYIRAVYNVYYALMLIACALTCYYTYVNTMITAFRSATVSNMIDQYAWWSVELVWLYILATTLIFLAWAMKWDGRLTELSRLVDEPVFDYLHKLEDEKDPFVRKRYQTVQIKCYFVCFAFIAEVLAWPILLYIVRGPTPRIVLYSMAFVPSVIICATLAASFACYVCTAELWNIYNYSLMKEADRLAYRSSTPTRPNSHEFDTLVARYSDRYDAMANLTATVAHTFRYYAIIHALTVVSLISQVYQTLFDKTAMIQFTVYAWFDVIVYLIPLFAAATVSNHSLRVAGCLHSFYKSYWTTITTSSAIRSSTSGKATTPDADDQQRTLLREPSAAYAYFYHRVANEDMCVSLDIGGMLNMTKTTVGALLFAAVNWCAVIMQFRQGSSGPEKVIAAIANITMNGTSL